MNKPFTTPQAEGRFAAAQSPQTQHSQTGSNHTGSIGLSGAWPSLGSWKLWPQPRPVSKTCSSWAKSNTSKRAAPTRADVIVVDAPAAGHALHFLKAPLAVQQAVRSGVLRQQATETLEMLGDEQRCQALLVTIAEETPISELIETAFAVEDEVGLALGPVIVNGVLPNIAGLSETKLNGKTTASAALHPQQVNDLSTATIFRQKRTILQNQQLNFLTQRLPLPQVYLPALFTSLIGLTELQTLADAFAQSIRHQASR